MYFDDIDYANKRLGGTLVRTKTGAPYMVASVSQIGRDIVCIGNFLGNPKAEGINLSEIDLTPVSLGFFNVGEKMFFACRRPMRKDWKQGLSPQNLLIYGGRLGEIGFEPLIQPITNNYPRVGEALSFLSKKDKASRAFSRDFGLSKRDGRLIICYRKYDVGEVKSGEFVLSPDKFFLQQHLSEAVGT